MSRRWICLLCVDDVPTSGQNPFDFITFFRNTGRRGRGKPLRLFFVPNLDFVTFSRKIKLGTVFVVEYSILEYCLMNFIFALK